MNCLVVIAHPLKDSLCRHLANKTVAHLRSQGHEITIKNLYEEEFNPVLSVVERASYYENEFDLKYLQVDIAQLQAAEMLVLVFPTWWYGFPAILKGWFDRVWAPGYAFKHSKDNGMIAPNLTKLKHLNVVTTLGSPWWADMFILRKPIQRILRMAIMNTCAKNCKLKMLSLYDSEKLTAQRVEKFVKKIEATF